MPASSSLRQAEYAALTGDFPTMDTQSALGWKRDWLGNLEMVWVKEPDIEVLTQIARRSLNVSNDLPCSVTFLTEGAFNKVYVVQCSTGTRYVMRIPIPAQPQLKTLSEVATVEYVQQRTSIPAPSIISFDASHSNELRFEWMLMDYVTGSQLEEQWRSMSWLKKELLVRKIISCLIHLFKKRFNRLGSLYKTGDLQQLGSTNAVVLDQDRRSNPHIEFCLNSVIQLPFFWGNNLELDVDRGPFSSSQDWLRTVLRLHSLAVDDPVAVMSDSDNDSDSDNSDDKPDPENTPAAIKRRVQRLMDLLPATFPADGPEAFVLHHHDLHAKNIFMGDDHELSGIIDWECISTVPLWAACEFPKFLQTELNRHVCPDPDRYMKEVLDDGTEELNVMYYEHLVEYEKTRLRAFFLEQMQRECPEWVEVYQNSKSKATFEEVVAALNDKSNATIIDEWLDTMEEHGSAPGIGDMLHEYEQELLDYELASSKGRKTKDAEATKE